MAAPFRVKVEGFRDTEKALTALGKTLAKAALRRTLIRAGEPIRSHAELLAPRDFGYLASHILIGRPLNKTERSKVRRAGNKSTVEIHIGPQSGTRSGIKQEFGTVFVRPHPFMRPAWDANKMRSLKLIQSELTVEIEKTAKRAERKARRLARKS